ncbi:MAG: hypothetical protein JWL60_729 [Gemmatimonadetes bacterium]|jgi:hypothetical protein|nr:hypothetical protein [Gemmatimonadota bacterium]
MRRRLVSRPPAGLLAALLLLGAAPRVHAQYSVTQVQPLAFGYLTPGVTEVVGYQDAFRRGVVALDGTGNVFVRVLMPAQLLSPQGGTIPLQFLAGDLAAQDAGKPPQAFDPAGSTRVNLAKGTGLLLIGGRALPAASQLAGSYSATMVVVVSSMKF